MLIRWLPLLAGLLPFLAVNLAYWIGVRNDVLPSCFPYIDGCTSISSTGRHPPGNLLFRAVHLPEGVLLHGRAGGSTPRGCSLAVDEILRGAVG